MAATALDDFNERLATLPARITRKQIAWLAEVSPETVEWWTRAPGLPRKFPKPLPSAGGPKAPKEYSRARVSAWLVQHLADETTRSGPRRPGSLRSWADISPADSRRMTDAELAALRGVTPAGITDYASRYGDREVDPFPPRDEDDKTRSVGEVAAWFTRHKSGTRGRRPADTITIPDTTPEMSDAERAAVLRAAFATLPEQCTTADISTVTGATGVTVGGWARRDTFPAPLTPKEFKPRVGTTAATYPSADVANWCLSHLFGAVEASSAT